MPEPLARTTPTNARPRPRAWTLTGSRVTLAPAVLSPASVSPAGPPPVTLSPVAPPAFPAPVLVPSIRNGPVLPPDDAPVTRGRWAHRLGRRLTATDAAVLAFAFGCAAVFRFGDDPRRVDGLAAYGVHLTYLPLAVLLSIGWLIALGLADSRDGAVVGIGPEEYRRVVSATLRLFAVVAVAAYLTRVDVARGYLVIALPLGTGLLLLERWLWRQWLVRVRRTGAWTDTVLAVGTPADVAVLAADLARTPEAGLRVIGACVPGPARYPQQADDGREGEHVEHSEHGDPTAGPGSATPVLGTVADLRTLLDRHAVHTVAVAAGVSTEVLRRVGWELEGTGVQLVVTPALTNIAKTRIHVRPVSGLALLHVDEPRLPHGGRIAKDVTDRVGALLLLIGCAPVFAAVALAVALTSPGPVFYRQDRIGCRGRVFALWKFRSMRAGADAELAGLLAAQNRGATPLFKVDDDPRITRVGRFLRRTSLDELPQLINVLAGRMSLVGPRPQRAAEVQLYDDLARRRLLTKPGMTGHWQVSGRNDLPWEEALRLDLYYVENWSYLFDVVLLSRTFWAVLRGRGAS